MPNLHEIAVSLTAKSAGFDQGINQAITSTKRLEDAMKRLQGTMKLTVPAVTPGTAAITNTNTASKSLLSTISGLTAGYVSLRGAINATKFAVTAASNMETQDRAWKAIAGSTKQAATELNFLRTTADKAGVNFDALEKGYRQIAAASKNTVLEGKATKDIFLAITEAGSRLGLSSDDVTGALRAISQMMSTGTVQADEFKNELGNRLPGIMAIGAKSIGVTTKEFMKLMEQGKLLPEELIPKLAVGIREKFVPSLAAGIEETKTLGQEFARMGNVITRLSAHLANDTGLTGWLKGVAKGWGDMGKEMDIADKKQQAMQHREGLIRENAQDTIISGREQQGLGPLSPGTLKDSSTALMAIEEQLIRMKREMTAMKPLEGWAKWNDMGHRAGDLERMHKEVADLEVQRALLLSKTAIMPGPTRRLPTPGFGETWGTEAPRDLSAATGELTALQQYDKEFADIEKRTMDYRRSLQGVAEEWEIAKKSADFYDKAVQKLQEDSAKLMQLQGRAPIALQSLIGESGARHGADPRWLEAIMKQESTFNPRAESKAGAMGLMQLMPDTAKDMGVKDPFNIQQSIEGGAKYWAQIQARYPLDIDRQLAAWNWGPNRKGVMNWQGAQTTPPETQDFIARVKTNAAAIKEGTSLPVAPHAFRTGLEDEFQSGERRHAISLLNLKVDQDRAEALERLLKSLNPVTDATDEEYRALELLRASSLGAAGDTDGMAVALKNVEDNIKLSNVSLNEYERALVTQTMAAELALMTDRDAAEAIRLKANEYLKASKGIETHKKALDEQEITQKALVESGKDLRQIDAERFRTIDDIIAQMKAGLPTIEEYEAALRKLKGLGAGPGPLAIAKNLEMQSTAAFKAIKQGAEDLANFLQDNLLSQLTPFTGGEAEDFGSRISTADDRVSRLENRRDRLSEQLFERPNDKGLLEQLRRTDEALVSAKEHLKEFENASIDAAEKAASPWRKFGDTLVQEFARIVMEGTKFREEMSKLLMQAGSALLKLIGGIAGGAGSSGDIDFNAGGGASSGDIDFALGGPVGAGQLARVGEAGRELMLSGGRMRLVGLHGPEVVRSREAAFVIPHQQTMTLLRKRGELDNVVHTMARRQFGGGLNAGQSAIVGEAGVEGMVSRGGKRSQGGNTINVYVQGVKDMQSFVQPRSQAEIQRALAATLRAAQGSL